MSVPLFCALFIKLTYWAGSKEERRFDTSVLAFFRVMLCKQVRYIKLSSEQTYSTSENLLSLNKSSKKWKIFSLTTRIEFSFSLTIVMSIFL